MEGTFDEASLRNLVRDRPQNGKAMATLAYVVAEKAKVLFKTNPDASESLINEALEWAKRSVQVSPHRPFGYIALSLVEKEFPTRLGALKKAVELCPESDAFLFRRLSLMIRLLRDPRIHEKQRLNGKVGRASCQHPSRRPLNQEECELYAKIARGLSEFWTKDDVSLSSRHEVALGEYRMGIFFRKRLPSAPSQERAKRHFQSAIQHLPPDDDNVAISKFWLGTLGAEKLDRCPSAYVVGLYSTFAENFDELLVEKLSYRTPHLLRVLLDEECVSKNVFNHALDLGCGTGLSGVAFRTCVGGKFVGVDLSPQMIAKARERGCYDFLEVDDVVSYLERKDESYFEFVCACDVLVYLGDLREVMQGVHRALCPGGLFAFSTELLEGSDVLENYVLHECARFSHSRMYLLHLAKETGFEILRTKVCPLRMNQGKEVTGLLMVLKRNSSA